VVIAIDDLQWLDRPTARAIAFVARRLPEKAAVIASRRLAAHDGTWLAQAAGSAVPERVEVLRLRPLDDGEVQQLLTARAPQLDRRARLQIQATSGGNPFCALELARAAPADRQGPWPASLPASLESIVDARLAGLGADVERALLAVAVLAHPTLHLLERLVGPDVWRLLGAAEDFDLIAFDGPRVRFTHPLLARGVYSRAARSERREMHRHASAVVVDPEERARHLAAAARPREAVPALDEAARHVRARGATETAAELLELALELGGDDELRVRAAEHHLDAGDPPRARATLEAAVRALPPGPARARALLLLGEVRYKSDSFPAARAVLEDARDEIGDREPDRVMLELRLAYVLFNLALRAPAAELTREALAHARALEEPALLAQALAVSVMLDFNLGRGLDVARLSEALELENQDERTTNELQPSLIAAFLFLWTGRFGEASALLDTMTARSEERGETHSLVWNQGYLRVWLRCWTGDLAGADRTAAEGFARLLELDTLVGRALALTARAQVDADAGHAARARSACEEAIELNQRIGWFPLQIRSEATIGYLDLVSSNSAAAADRLAPLALGPIAAGQLEPAAGGLLLAGDAAEALIAVGRTSEAEIIVDWLEARGAALDRAWAIAVGARCRGLLLSASGDLAGAELAAERASEVHERLPMPIERGRTLLALGRIRRRRRRRRAAKAALDEALAIFEQVGSPPWVEKVSAELSCLGLEPGSGERLTPSEERVARLAASGRTNAAVAAMLHVSPKTVEAQLARAYRKLDIHSRAELGARMAGPETGARGAAHAGSVERDEAAGPEV
jgi:DNA-binding CsgD family transcriptional regulator